MKKYFSLILLTLFFNYINAQEKADWQIFNLIPTTTVVKLNNTKCTFNKLFKKNKANVVIFFNPECDHCQQEIKMIVDNMATLNQINFILICNRPFFMLQAFSKKYRVSTCSNIIIAQDISNALVRFYKIGGFPSMITYNKIGQCTNQFISSQVSKSDILKNTQ